jgi:hypothetical protein
MASLSLGTTDTNEFAVTKASDKCRRESECLSFREHLLATSALLANGDDTMDIPNPTLIFTSESKDMLREYHQFNSNKSAQSALPHRFRLVTNEHDVTPDSGFAPSIFGDANGGIGGATNSSSHRSRNLGKSSFSADEAMLSAMSSIRHQLLARVTVGNCCSNFHVLLADLLASGCGAARRNTFHCLQEHPDPRYRVCCGWFRNCKEDKRREIALTMIVDTPASSTKAATAAQASSGAAMEPPVASKRQQYFVDAEEVRP